MSFDHADPGELTAFRTDHPDIATVDALITDINGNLIGKRMPISEASGLFDKGAQIPASALLLDGRGVGHNPVGMGRSDGDPDASMVPLSGTLVRVPWTERPTAQVLCSLTHEGAPVWYDPRKILADVVARCRADGFHPVVACELEFYLLERSREPSGAPRPAPSPRTGAAAREPAMLSVSTLDDHAAVLAGIEDAAAAQHVPLTYVTAECGVAQFEINLRHQDDPLLAADHAVSMRRLVKGAARAAGLDATFMARPFLDQPGSGMHIHVSLLDERGRNCFAEDEAMLRHAIGGMQAAMYDSVALFAPNFNAFRRFAASWVPRSTSWGENNRTVAFRVPLSEPHARRIEHRVAGADASPHLVLAAVLAGLHAGIIHRHDPGDPVGSVSLSALAEDFPTDLLSALVRMEASPLLREYFPPRFLEAFATVRRGEQAQLLGPILPREYDYYL